MREQYIETSRGRIWTGVFGEEKQGIPLLVIHGGPGFMSLTDVVSDLGAERPVYFYDQLGSGNSDKAADPNDYSVDGFVEELDEVRNRLGLVEVVLMGFSWGCALAVSYVLQKKPSGIPSCDDGLLRQVRVSSGSLAAVADGGFREIEYGCVPDYVGTERVHHLG